MTPQPGCSTSASPASLAVVSPGMDALLRCCQPDMVIRLSAGMSPAALLQPVHSHVLAAASPLLADWVAEFGQPASYDMLHTAGSPSYSHINIDVTSPAGSWREEDLCVDQCSSPGSAHSASAGSPPTFGGPSCLVLPAEGDDPDAWAKVLALIYPSVALPAGGTSPVLNKDMPGPHQQVQNGVARKSTQAGLLPGSNHPPLTSHDSALTTWEDVEQVYCLGHKYNMSGVMSACRTRLTAAVQATCDTMNPELWTPEAGRTFSDMQAAYQARLDRASQGFCLNDPLSPVFILRWLAFAVHFHEADLECALQRLCKANASTVFVHHGGTADSGARNAAFLHWWNTLGHAYCLKLTTPPSDIQRLCLPQVTAASSLTRTPSQAAAHAAAAKSPGDQAGEIYREGTTAWALLYGM